MLAAMEAGVRPLRRAVEGRRIAGLCAGFASRYGYDVSTARVVWIFVTLVTGIAPGVLTYLLAWAFVPSESD